MSKMVERYQWGKLAGTLQSGAPITEKSAEVVGRHLAKLQDQVAGKLTPHVVVDDARFLDSPLHSFFEWDDSTAAEAHRLNQARALVQCVYAVYPQEDREPTIIRALVHVPERGSPHYRDVAGALEEQASRELVLSRALRELTAWRQRYQDLQEFATLCATIDEVVNKVQRGQRSKRKLPENDQPTV